MREYSYLSERSNKIAVYLSGALFASAVVVLALIATFSFSYKGILQGLCALLLSVAVLVLTRYVFKSFLLAVAQNDRGSYDFTITEIYGKNRLTVCRVSLSGIERIERHTKENDAELRAAEKGRRIYSYCPDICPEREYFVFVTECEEPLLLKISPDDTLVSIFEAAAAQNSSHEE